MEAQVANTGQRQDSIIKKYLIKTKDQGGRTVIYRDRRLLGKHVILDLGDTCRKWIVQILKQKGSLCKVLMREPN